MSNLMVLCVIGIPAGEKMTMPWMLDVSSRSGSSGPSVV